MTEKVWVRVDCIQTFRTTYMVQTPKDHPEYACDTVTMNRAREYSQDFLGENIIFFRPVKEKIALEDYRRENEISDDLSYIWTDEVIKANGFTVDDGFDPEEVK